MSAANFAVQALLSHAIISDHKRLMMDEVCPEDFVRFASVAAAGYRNEVLASDNQFAIRAMFDESAGSDGAVTLLFGGSAIIRRVPCMFHYTNEFEDDATDGCG